MFSPTDLAPMSSRAAIGGFHDPRPAARHHGEMGLALGVAVLRDQPGELAGDVVVAALGHDPLGLGHGPLAHGIARRFGQSRRASSRRRQGLGRFDDPRAAEDHDRVLDAVVLQREIGLEELQFHPRRPQPGAVQEIDVLIGQIDSWASG